jgi:exopolysaccharide biosynthesis polyprenyl glycosylphosphotransferase
MLRRFSTRRIVGLFAIDWLGTLGILLLAAFLRRELGTLPAPVVGVAGALEVTLGGTQSDAATVGVFSMPLQVFVLVALIWPFFLVVFSVYDARQNKTLGTELRNVFLAIFVSTLTLAGALYFTYRETSRVLVLTFFVLDVLLLLGVRIVLSTYSRNGRRGTKRRSVIIVGAGDVGCRAVEQLQQYAWSNIRLVGFVDDDLDKQGQRVRGLPVLGTLDRLQEIVESEGIHDALVALPLQAYERQIEVCTLLQRQWVHVHVIPDLFALSFPSATLDGFGGIPVIDLGQPGIHGLQRLSKRVFDVAVATLSLLVLSPVLAVVAVLIKLDSPGETIYRQQRIGEHGRLFNMLKFRSMRADADSSVHKAHVTRLIEQNLTAEQLEENGGETLKMQDDPRVTRVGKLIRKTSIDELPQLFNVLRGEMSLVGPRPPLPYEAELYQDWHKRRFETLPGITGWWQVKGRNRVSFDEMIRMDLYYAEHSSLWLDLRILLQTPWAVISGRGAG